MATQYSPDLFLEDVDIVVIFLTDGVVFHIQNLDTKGRRHECGDLVHIDRGTFLDEKETGLEPAVILGWGVTSEEARRNSFEYVKRLAKWHGQEEDKCNLFGFDMTQTELFIEPNNDPETEEHQEDSQEMEEFSQLL